MERRQPITGYLPPLLTETRALHQSHMLKSQAFGEREEQIWRNRWMTRPTAKPPTRHHCSPGWVTGQAPPRTPLRRGVPLAPGTCTGRGGGEGEPHGCPQTLGGGQVESEGTGGRDLRAGFTAVPLPLTPGDARSSQGHHLFHSKVWDYSDSIFFPLCLVYAQYTGSFTQGTA